MGVLITLPQGALKPSENTYIYIAIHSSLYGLILCLVLNVIYALVTPGCTGQVPSYYFKIPCLTTMPVSPFVCLAGT